MSKKVKEKICSSLLLLEITFTGLEMVIVIQQVKACGNLFGQKSMALSHKTTIGLLLWEIMIMVVMMLTLCVLGRLTRYALAIKKGTVLHQNTTCQIIPIFIDLMSFLLNSLVWIQIKEIAHMELEVMELQVTLKNVVAQNQLVDF
jgi:hypothetical protein